VAEREPPAFSRFQVAVSKHTVWDGARDRSGSRQTLPGAAKPDRTTSIGKKSGSFGTLVWYSGQEQRRIAFKWRQQDCTINMVRPVNRSGGKFPPVALMPLTEADVVEAARLYTEVFLSDEPTSRRHAPDPALVCRHARIYIRSLVGSGLSMLCRDQVTGELAGFIFCFDALEDSDRGREETAWFASAFREAMAMIDVLENRYLDRTTISAGEVLHIFQIGVARPYRGRGIARSLVSKALMSAQARGFRQVVADCTSTASRHVFERCGFLEEGFSPFELFSLDDIRFFAGLDGGISLMIKDLQDTP
jgi:ribosomal protein S18 acetylase RimI-like enzyme